MKSRVVFCDYNMGGPTASGMYACTPSAMASRLLLRLAPVRMPKHRGQLASLAELHSVVSCAVG